MHPLTGDRQKVVHFLAVLGASNIIGDETIADSVCDRLVHNAHK